MSKQRHGGEDEKSCPFCLREPHGLERRNKRRLFRHHKLQGESDRQRQNHQPVIHRIHPENRLFHIPHPDRVEKLGQSQDGKGTVSYTHLDVYKRQSFGSLATSTQERAGQSFAKYFA